jgi:hypothetical protein
MKSLIQLGSLQIAGMATPVLKAAIQPVQNLNPQPGA